MKTFITLVVMLVFGTCSVNAASIPIYDTLNDPFSAYVYSINFPISQKFTVQENATIANIIVGIPSKITPGRQLTVGFYDLGFNLLKSYSSPNDYYVNVDHFYSYDGEMFNLPPGDYYLRIKMSNGPTGWVNTTGGMLARIDAYCVPETESMGIIVCLFFGGLIVYRWKLDNLKTRQM